LWPSLNLYKLTDFINAFSNRDIVQNNHEKLTW